MHSICTKQNGKITTQGHTFFFAITFTLSNTKGIRARRWFTSLFPHHSRNISHARQWRAYPKVLCHMTYLPSQSFFFSWLWWESDGSLVVKLSNCHNWDSVESDYFMRHKNRIPPVLDFSRSCCTKSCVSVRVWRVCVCIVRHCYSLCFVPTVQSCPSLALRFYLSKLCDKSVMNTV